MPDGQLITQIHRDPSQIEPTLARPPTQQLVHHRPISLAAEEFGHHIPNLHCVGHRGLVVPGPPHSLRRGVPHLLGRADPRASEQHEESGLREFLGGKRGDPRALAGTPETGRHVVVRPQLVVRSHGA